MPKKRYALVWTASALQDLLGIVQYIKIDKPSAAHRFGRQIKKKTSRLAQFPDSGRVVPEFSMRGLRELLVGDYRIIYWIVSSKSQVQILTVFHGAKPIKGKEAS